MKKSGEVYESFRRSNVSSSITSEEIYGVFVGRVSKVYTGKFSEEKKINII